MANNRHISTPQLCSALSRLGLSTLIILLSATQGLRAQIPSVLQISQVVDEGSKEITTPTRVSAPGVGDWLIHGQSTYILQGHGAFPAPYEGDNSLRSKREAEAPSVPPST